MIEEAERMLGFFVDGRSTFVCVVAEVVRPRVRCAYPGNKGIAVHAGSVDRWPKFSREFHRRPGRLAWNVAG
ncbi:MAG: hypothetical protein ACREP4_08275 [Stenotrophomonas sp.]|uniref:hypothetical protein n=1 Tax=Stenotrophomonas sp. TaxID=69392 RepID=UPI003D6D8EC1